MNEVKFEMECISVEKWIRNVTFHLGMARTAALPLDRTTWLLQAIGDLKCAKLQLDRCRKMLR